MRILRARMLAAARDAAASASADARRSQVRTVDRSERVRTYNFAENRIADHRVGFKAYNLDAVLDGDMDAVLDSLDQADRAERLAGRGPRGAGIVAGAHHGRHGSPDRVRRTQPAVRRRRTGRPHARRVQDPTRTAPAGRV